MCKCMLSLGVLPSHTDIWTVVLLEDHPRVQAHSHCPQPPLFYNLELQVRHWSGAEGPGR